MGKVYGSPPGLATQPYVLIDENDLGETRTPAQAQCPEMIVL